VFDIRMEKMRKRSGLADLDKQWLNPMENQSTRFLIQQDRAHKSWEDSQGESNGL
jgi:hypothetical protein